jgi:SAM-dependent methyltransferase
MQLDRDFWESRYTGADTGWDLGGPSTPLKEYIDQLTNTELRILIPGAGRAYEAEYLHRRGFKNVFVIDLADAPFTDLLERCPDFPKEHLIVGDFFEHQASYDLIIEQTFFCALDPSLRERYVKKMHELLVPVGKLVGVLFDDPQPGRVPGMPPFGGNAMEYNALFRTLFPQVSFERCHNSISPRAGREVWIAATK